MKLNQEPGLEMQALMRAVRNEIDSTVQTCMKSLESGPDREAPETEQKAYQELHAALTTPEQVSALEGVIKNACLAMLHSFLTAIDEGVEGPGGRPLKLDIVDKSDGESIITWSAQEEFWYCVSDGYVPFDYD